MMKTGFYPKLALDGIRKNKRLYFPYILTGCIMVMMYYILSFLSESPAVLHMKGGTTLSAFLPMGCCVIAVFALLFLFYTNSFLIKQRYHEFGLYNILGMDKKNIGKIMVRETMITAAAAVIIGLITGVILSKAAELILLNILKSDINYEISVGITSLWQTAAVFGAIYLILLINSLIRVGISKPIELIQTAKAGERVPKITGLFAICGIICLTAAYYLAVSIKEPLAALIYFFVAVLLVIIGTYLIFIAGSVVFCKLLQKNKKYYYKANHFISVSSMIYRMKRNGAGLASICILLTMVLVMIASTSCLYFGAEDAAIARCPNSINITATFDNINGISDENLDKFRETIRSCSDEATDLSGIRACEIPGLFTDNGMLTDYENASAIDKISYDRLGYLSVISLADYNILMGENKALDSNECLIYCNRLDYTASTFTAEYGSTYTVKEHLTEFKADGESLAMTMPVVYLIVKDLYSFAEPFSEMKNSADEPMMTYDWRCGFDLNNPYAEKAMVSLLENAVAKLTYDSPDGMHMRYMNTVSREESRKAFYDMYGSLFFLGIMLSVVFLIAAVLIIYYKQISEGYEDRARFEIMQKVGMTKRDIRKSINSQMLTVFFLPLLLAGVHLCFAFPFIAKILLMFAFDNTWLSIAVNIACFAAFGLFYAVTYKITSVAYYSIVSGGKDI